MTDKEVNPVADERTGKCRQHRPRKLKQATIDQRGRREDSRLAFEKRADRQGQVAKFLDEFFHACLNPLYFAFFYHVRHGLRLIALLQVSLVCFVKMTSPLDSLI